MTIDLKLAAACKEGGVGEPTFVRISYYYSQKKSLKRVRNQVIHLLWTLKAREIKELYWKKQGTAVLIMGKFMDEGLFNISLAQMTQQLPPLLKVEVVGRGGMLQYDTSADNAFSGRYQLELLPAVAAPEEQQQIDVLFQTWAISKDMLEEWE